MKRDLIFRQANRRRLSKRPRGPFIVVTKKRVYRIRDRPRRWWHVAIT